MQQIAYRVIPLKSNVVNHICASRIRIAPEGPETIQGNWRAMCHECIEETYRCIRRIDRSFTECTRLNASAVRAHGHDEIRSVQKDEVAKEKEEGIKQISSRQTLQSSARDDLRLILSFQRDWLVKEQKRKQMKKQEKLRRQVRVRVEVDVETLLMLVFQAMSTRVKGRKRRKEAIMC